MSESLETFLNIYRNGFNRKVNEEELIAKWNRIMQNYATGICAKIAKVRN